MPDCRAISGPLLGRRRPRLRAKVHRLAGIGKHAAKIVATVARELAGFIRDIARRAIAPVSRLA